METDLSLSSSSSSDEYTDQPIDAITLGFNRQLDLQSHDAASSSSSSKLLPDTEVGVDEEEEDDDDDDFTFMFVGTDDTAAIEGEKVLEEGQMFPLFDQKLLLDGDYEVEEIDGLPIQPPVEKIFIPSSANEETHDDGPYCVWSSKESTTGTAELSKKSNSTGFSKLWRLKDKGGRSNSYGRDAFVFFKSSSDKKMTTTTTTGSSSSSATSVDGTFKVNVTGGKAKVVRKGTKSRVSALEAYLKNREEDRRRSYRPEQMGFFTNVHGGLTKNVHPY